MNGFAFRGLEIHSARMWQEAQVLRALDFIQSMGMTALVFNQNDILDAVVYPEKYFPDWLMWKRWPPRNCAVKNNRCYINHVIEMARQRGIEFYFECKELAFPAGLLEIQPQLVGKDGALCPFDPFWQEFLFEKLRELLRVVPDFSGIIFSIGTRESMLSIAANQCHCPRCQSHTELDWYRLVFQTILDALKPAGKKMIIRDFSFTGDQQSVMLQAAKECSGDIVISLKNTPRDYYPPYPTNPHIGLSGLSEWIEFDTWGQFFGLGIFPVSVVEDMQARFRECKSRGASGILLRTDWECATEGSAFSGMNLLNVYAGAMLALDIERDLDDIYRKWAKSGYISALRPASCLTAPVIPSAPDAYRPLRDFMRASWKVMEKTNYVRSLLLGESVMPPDTVQKAFDMMVHVHGRDDWEPGSSDRVKPTEENIAVIFAEKDEALREARALPSILRPETLGLPDDVVLEILDWLDLYVYFVQMMRVSTRVCFQTRKAALTKDPGDLSAARAELAELRAFTARLAKRLARQPYMHLVSFTLNIDRLSRLANDVTEQLAKAEGNAHA